MCTCLSVEKSYFLLLPKIRHYKVTALFFYLPFLVLDICMSFLSPLSSHRGVSWHLLEMKSLVMQKHCLVLALHATFRPPKLTSHSLSFLSCFLPSFFCILSFWFICLWLLWLLAVVAVAVVVVTNCCCCCWYCYCCCSCCCCCTELQLLLRLFLFCCSVLWQLLLLVIVVADVDASLF